MPRKPRVEAAGAVHHVVARGNAGIRIVRDDVDRCSVVAGLARVCERYSWRVHAYCVMDTHLHAVVETPEPNLGAGMKRLVGGYAFEFNRRHSRFGHLFAGPFSASLVETEKYVLEVCAYVVLNPVRAGLVRAPEDWRWSSYRGSTGLVTAPPFLETSRVPGLLHPNRRRAEKLFRQLVHETAERPRTGSG